ncbi:MAG: nucleotidyl transferase AbiEii/AbiGii toxin family protein [Spirochaetales bacterium]|nr:nucleotidyl transferase AbiEii/AbiGii toxin family protein [Spirochaetales bacterium]
MNHDDIKKLILKAIYSNEELYDQLVLKGGNALSLVYNVGNRNSLDLDFSIENDFDDMKKVASYILGALTSSFEKYGIIIFDFNFTRKPQKTHVDWWGGYRAEFKLITKSLALNLDNKIDRMRRQSMLVDIGSQRRRYTIEISKYEYIDEKSKKKIDEVEIYVYSPLLLAVEKLRALFQQHPDYPHISENTKRSRGRDLYDIWAICDYFSIKLEMYLSTVEEVFKAKKVDLSLLNKLEDVKELHRASWEDVGSSVAGDIRPYEYYFEFVNASALHLYAKWVKDTP